MSVITSLKAIDIQKHTIATILDALGVDIDTEDGHLYYSADPAICLQINNKVLRLDIGKMRRGIQYTNFNPLYREDHAQFLMTMAIYSQVIDDFLDPDEAQADDFEIYTEIVFPSDGKDTMIPHTLATVTRQYGNKERGQGFHKELPIAIVLAVLDFANQLGYITGDTFKKLRDTIDEAYVDYLKMTEMKTSERRRDLKEKAALLKPEIEYDEQVFYDDELNPEKDSCVSEFIENDETWNEPQMKDSDFIQNSEQDYLKDDIDWNVSNFTDEDLMDILGVKFQKKRSGLSGVSIDDISDIGYVSQEQAEPPAPDLYVPGNEFGSGMYPQNFQTTPALTMIPKDETPLPDIKLEDVVSKTDLDQIKQRETESRPKIEDFLNVQTYDVNTGVGYNDNPFQSNGMNGIFYIPQ